MTHLLYFCVGGKTFSHLSTTPYLKINEVLLSMKEKGEQCTMLIDMGAVLYSTPEESKPLQDLMAICNLALNSSHCCTVIALSSGAGVMLAYSQRTLYPFFMHLNGKAKCTFTTFTISETKMYLGKKGLKLDTALVKRLTHLNPLLLSSIPITGDEHKIRGYINNWVLTYIRDVLKVLIELGTLNSWLNNELKKSVKWLYEVENQISLSQKEKCDFLESWLSIQGICSIAEEDNVLNCNFPGVARLLLDELAKMRQDNRLPSNPIVNGYIFEENFFVEIGKTKTLHITIMEKSITLYFALVEKMQTGEILDSMTSGVLYHLRYQHPVIDAVGVMEKGSKKKQWLVMIQVSLSPYAAHRSKIGDLLRYVQCQELSHSDHDTFLKYYLRLNKNIKEHRIVYVYVSPSELGSNLSYKGEDCLQFGVVQENTDS